MLSNQNNGSEQSSHQWKEEKDETKMTDKKNILVVDSEEEHLTYISKTLMKYGYRIITARDGKEALESLHKRQYNLLITDLILDDMTGTDFVKAVKAYDPMIGVIIVSACEAFDLYLEMMNLGVLVYLNKPIKPKKLKEAVSKYLVGSLAEPSTQNATRTRYVA